ncbi:MAG: hypothetical protein RL199_323 [Pseudomonadota bacterium]|jgi:hypothetical protein
MTRTIPAALFLACAAVLGACSSAVQTVTLELVTQPCGDAPAVDSLTGLDNNARLQVRVYGAGIDTAEFTEYQVVSAGTLTLPAIPAGNERRIVVEVMDGTAEKRVVARGEVGPLDLDETTEPLTVKVFLRTVNAFTAVATAADPGGNCATMSTARAGHTATTLSDGRVLVVGGFSGSRSSHTFLKSTELFDPRTGTFTAGPDMEVARAFHTATRLPGTGVVVIVGGESDAKAIARVDFYDEVTGTFARSTSLKSPRTRHAAAATEGSLLLVAGGLDDKGNILNTTETFTMQTKAFAFGPPMVSKRGSPSAIALPDRRILVVGGYDDATGTAVGKTELFTQLPAGDKFNRTDAAAIAGRVAPALAVWGTDQVIVAGGTKFFDVANPFASASAASNSTFVVGLSGGISATSGPDLSTARAGAGAVTLRDGSVFVGGGAYQDRPLRVTPTAELLVRDTKSGKPVRDDVRGEMALGRQLAAWTLLADGTVLATGGLMNESDGDKVLVTAEVFQPSYESSTASPYR